MLANKSVIFVLTLALMLVACGSGDSEDANNIIGSDPGGNSDGTWLIPVGKVKDGGPGKDGIPSLDFPDFVGATSAEGNAVADHQLVVGVYMNGSAKAYPHNILDWHEVVNDKVSGVNITLSYCPLTGSAITWKDASLETDRTFGVSGLLYNSNLILYDRATDSNWSQMLQQAVFGPKSGDLLSAKQVLTIETTWRQWKIWFPETLLLSEETEFSRNYNLYPYGDYLGSSATLFAVDNQDDERMFAKERALGVMIENGTKIYQISEFDDDFQVLNESIANVPYLVIGSRDSQFALALSRLHDGETLEFQAVFDQQRFLLEDQHGRQWNIFGHGVSEDVNGQRLKMVTHYTAFWFAWTAFFNNLEIVNIP